MGQRGWSVGAWVGSEQRGGDKKTFIMPIHCEGEIADLLLR